MLALAQMIMRGRLNAVLIALLFFAVPLPALFIIGASAVGLVTLRHGGYEGLLVMIWSLLPAIGWAIMAHQIEPLLCLISVFCLALVLRATSSWALTLLLFIPLMMLINVLALDSFQSQIANAIQFIKKEFGSITGLFPQIGDQNAGLTESQLETVLYVSMLKSLSFISTLTALFPLILARYWQAALYNLGGFGEEFRKIRLPRLLVIILIVGIYLLSLDSFTTNLLLVIQPTLLIPLIVVGTSIVHSLAKSRNMGAGWLVLYYLLLTVFYPWMAGAMMLLACVDSFIDIRSRIAIVNNK